MEQPTGDPANVPATGTGPEDLLIDDELWQALRDLPPKQRAIVVLRFCEDLGVEEVGQLLDLPIGTVKAYTHRALAALRARLSGRAPATPTRSAGTAPDVTGGAA